MRHAHRARVGAIALALVCALSASCDRSRPHFESRSVQEWLVVIRDSSPAGDSTATAALAKLAAAHAESMDALINGLRDPSPHVRIASIHALRALGGFALPAYDEMEKVLANDPEAGVRADAARAIGSATSGHNWAVGALVGGLRDSVPIVRIGAAEGLGLVGDAAREALPSLVAAAQSDTDPRVRAAAIAAIRLVRASP